MISGFRSRVSLSPRYVDVFLACAICVHLTGFIRFRPFGSAFYCGPIENIELGAVVSDAFDSEFVCHWVLELRSMGILKEIGRLFCWLSVCQSQNGHGFCDFLKGCSWFLVSV